MPNTTSACVRSFPYQLSRLTTTRAAADHGKVQTVYNNFEISDLDFWRGEAYTAYFDHLERTGGFYYEVSDPPFLDFVLFFFPNRDLRV